jgi:hypothetical protein
MKAAKKTPITLLFGLAAALCMILAVLGTYLAGPEAFLSWILWLGRAMAVILASAAVVIEKRSKNGILDFRGALKTAYGVLALAEAAHTFFAWLLLNVIDPHFRQLLIPVDLAKTESAYRRFGGSEEQLRQVLDGIRTQNQFSLGRMIAGMGFMLVLYFVIALLIAASARTKTGSPARPRVPEPTNQPNDPQPL